MEIKLTLNGERIVQDIEPDLLLIDFVRKNGCYSVKRGCDTSNCGLCTVLLNDKPVLSLSVASLWILLPKNIFFNFSYSLRNN